MHASLAKEEQEPAGPRQTLSSTHCAMLNDRLRRPFSRFHAAFHETLVVESAVFAGEVQVPNRFTGGAAQRGPLARPVAGITAQRPFLRGPVHARFALIAACRGDAGPQRIQLLRRAVGLGLRRVGTDLQSVSAADEVGENAGGA